MNQIPWGDAAAIFLGTLPLLAVLLWFTVDMARERNRRRKGS